MQRQPGTPRNGVRIGRVMAAVCALAAALIVPLTDAALAQSPQAPHAGTSPIAAPPARSRRGAGAKKGGGATTQSGAGDKSGAENSPFGMMQFSANNGPIQIKADSLNLDYKNNLVEFDGAVHATQSGTTLTAKSLKVIYGAKFGDIKQVIALGDVKMMQGGRWATGQRAVLDEQKHTVEMTGLPVIHDGPDSVAGKRIIIYLDSEKSFVEGASAVIFPRNNGKMDHEAAE
jgi:lipopolysaccharide export system protein LptA